MGLFSGSTKTYVSSVLYNLAGDLAERTNYLSHLTISGALAPGDRSIAETIVDGTLHGPGLRHRHFARWAETHFSKGIPVNVRSSRPVLDAAVIEAEIPTSDGDNLIWVQVAEMGRADYRQWAEAWVMAHHPDRLSTAWKARINAADLITITWADLTTDSFTPSDFDRSKKYLYARYVEIEIDGTGYTGFSEPQLFIYEMGSGNVDLDALDDEAATDFGGFFPMIPVRTHNLFVDEAPYASTIQEEAAKAWKKASGGQSLADLILNIEDNPDLEDIDHAFVVFGVPLNSQSNASCRYLFEFFRDLATYQFGTDTDYDTYASNQSSYGAYQAEVESWITAVEGGDPTATRPSSLLYPQSSRTALRLHPDDPDTEHMDFTLSWAFIKETTHSGLGRTGAKKGDAWVTKETSYNWDDSFWSPSQATFFHRDLIDDVFHVYFQENSDSYRRLKVVGLVHENHVYNNKSVVISSDEALDDPDESGLFLPLVQSTLHKLPLTVANQLGTESTLLIFNCYEEVKQRWYQTWIFKIALVLVSMALTAATGGLGLAGMTGILGTNAAVGAALGLSGLAAAVVGAAVNALAAMLVTQLISQVSVRLFGQRLGALIGAIASVMALQVGSGLAAGNFHWESLMRADNLLRLTEAGIQGYTKALALSTADTYADLQALQTAYEEKSGEIRDLTYETFGSQSGFDPLALTDTFAIAFEKPQDYLARTLMVGSDIADLTREMISGFTAQTLTLQIG